MSHRASRLRARPSNGSLSTRARVRAADPPRRDRGNTLIEIIITISLMGIVVGVMLSAVATSITASSTSLSSSQIETALVNAADRVNRAPKRCDYTIYAQAAAQTQGWPASSVTVTHQYYIPGATAQSTGTWAVGDPLTPGCPGPTVPDLLVQRVTVNLTTPDGRVRRSIQVVKSDV
jgi:Tfp pilus assembly protein PilE